MELPHTKGLVIILEKSVLHYATHDRHLMHGHRKLCLVEDFEMLHLTGDFKTFLNHVSDTIFSDYASDVQDESGYVREVLSKGWAISYRNASLTHCAKYGSLL